MKIQRYAVALTLVASSCGPCIANLLQAHGKTLASELSDDGLNDRDWEGLEALSDEQELAANKHLALLDTPTRSDSTTAAGPVFVVTGQYDTGTNLVRKLIERNFPAAKAFRGHFWKHVKPANLKRSLRAAFKAKNVLAVVVVRNPMSWLQSMKKAGYDLATCTTTAGWLTYPCSTPPSFMYPDSQPGEKEVLMQNIEGFWNEWVRDYMHMTDFSFAGAIVVRYEDLVMDTDAELARIGKFFHQPMRGPPLQVFGAAKNHGSSFGHSGAVHKIKTKSYLNLYSPQDMQAACERLDRELMRKLNYNDCASVHEVAPSANPDSGALGTFQAWFKSHSKRAQYFQSLLNGADAGPVTEVSSTSLKANPSERDEMLAPPAASTGFLAGSSIA